jgi:hypothetical protein
MMDSYRQRIIFSHEKKTLQFNVETSETKQKRFFVTETSEIKFVFNYFDTESSETKQNADVSIYRTIETSETKNIFVLINIETSETNETFSFCFDLRVWNEKLSS